MKLTNDHHFGSPVLPFWGGTIAVGGKDEANTHAYAGFCMDGYWAAIGRGMSEPFGISNI